MHGRLDKKVAIVIGSGRGIGKSIAKIFAAEGATVLAVGIHEDTGLKTVEEIRTAGGNASYLKADLSVGRDMEEMARVAVERYGRIDVLCQNAALTSQVNIEDMSEEDWESVSAVNLKGTFLAVKACLPQMIAQKYGRILMTSSVTGPRTAIRGAAHYAATKSGINGFIRAAAVELGKYNITVNGIEPGTIDTEGIREQLSEAEVQALARTIPLGKLGDPEDAAYAMLFLASDEAKYITGQTIIVDGGAILPEYKIG
jgi:3-oxoacyl-[acyl-carrier protein] reductase